MKDVYIFLAFILFSVIFKSIGLGQSSYDWDESTYLIMGKLWINGDSIYKDFIDTKPIGIVIISSLCNIFKSEYAIVAFRILGAIFVSLGGFFSYLALKKTIVNKKIAIIGGSIFIGMFYFISSPSAWKNGFGLESNTEHFFVPLIPISIFLLFSKKKSFLLLSGFVLGLSFIIKYFVIIDAILILIFIMISSLYGKNKTFKNFLSGFKNCFLWGISFSTPFVITVLFFYFSEQWNDFYFVTFEVGANYSSNLEFMPLMEFVIRIFYFFPLFILLILFNFFNHNRNNRIWFQIGIIWLLVDLIFITIIGKYFSHYYYQLIPPLCLLTSISLNNLSPKKFIITNFILISLTLISLTIRLITEMNRINFPKKIASYILNEDKNPTIYCANYEHIIYLLCNTYPPTRYVHPDLIYNTKFSSVLGINSKLEINKILSTSPNWIIIKGNFPLLQMDFNTNYQLEKTFDGNVKLYKNINLF